MKSIFNAISVIVLAILLFVPSTGFAQAQEVIPVESQPVGNLNNVIMGDTLSNGDRAHPNCIYELKRDEVYFYTGSLNVDFPLTIVAEEGDGKLPVIEPAILSDNSKPSTFINLLGGNLTLKNIYHFNLGPDETRTAYCILVTGTNLKVNIDGCIFDSEYATVRDNGCEHNSYFFTNNHFRNSQSPTSWFWGAVLALRNGSVPNDTVSFVNNTMFCNNRGVQVPGYNKKFIFDHNTVFLLAVNPMGLYGCTDGQVTNNIFYGMEAEGQRQVEIDGGWFEDHGHLTSIISMDTLKDDRKEEFGLTEEMRTVTVANNVYFWPEALTDKWQAINDTAQTDAAKVYPPQWMNERTQGMFADKTTWPGLEAVNNLNVDPGFDATMSAECLDKLVHYVDLTRHGGLATYLWYYNPGGGSRYPVVQPVPENLVYSNASLYNAGTDGFAIGDLNWFPEQKADFDGETDVEEIATAIPTGFDLAQNYPNPFNPTTNIKFNIAEQGSYKLQVFNVLGQIVAELYNGQLNAGQYEATFDAAKLGSGVYFYNLTGENVNITKKMMLMK